MAIGGGILLWVTVFSPLVRYPLFLSATNYIILVGIVTCWVVISRLIWWWWGKQKGCELNRHIQRIRLTFEMQQNAKAAIRVEGVIQISNLESHTTFYMPVAYDDF